MDQLHIFFRDLRKVIFVFLKSLFRIMSQKDRIGEPGNIPGPVRIRIVQSEIYLTCGFDIRSTFGIRDRHGTGRCETDLNLFLCIFAQIDHGAAMCFQRIVYDTEGILDRQFLGRCMDTGAVTQTGKAFRLV